MASTEVARHVLVTRRIEEVSGIRPVTLLIASGIALITVILMLTGIAVNHLRQQAMVAAQSELVRIDSVLSEASNWALQVVDFRLGEIADGLSPSGAAGFREVAAAPDTARLLQSKLARSPRLEAIAVIAVDGQVLSHAGAWPAGDAARRELTAAFAAPPAHTGYVGSALRDPATGVRHIPLVRRIDGPAGTPLGGVVGLVPASDFTSLFAAVPLPRDAMIALLRPDGTTLAQYPAPSDAAALDAGNQAGPAPGFVAGMATVVSRIVGSDGNWRLEALHPLSNYPAAVTISRSADQVLGEWALEGLWFAAFALVLAVAIAIMVYLVARQFQSHAALAEMRADRIEAEKIEIERARLAAEAELLKSERLSVLGKLTATVAHELRNPLSAIRNTLFTVRELTATAGLKLDRPIGRMERSIERCDRIISDLLEYTRNRDLNRNGIRLDRWLAELLAEQPIPAPVVLAAELAAGDAMADIDPDRFRRVVINLVENAAQALAETGADREKRIAVRTTARNDELVLVVEDNGPGISPDNLGRIFEPLFSTKSFGTGLGLPTVKQIVNQHGGTIEVDSEVGQGTRVTVRLPLPADAMQDVKVAA